LEFLGIYPLWSQVKLAPHFNSLVLRTFTTGLIIYAAGFGFPVLVRSMISSAATAYNLPIPLLFSGLAITETAGSFIGATLLTTAFVKTLGLHGWLQGLPFWICAVSACSQVFDMILISARYFTRLLQSQHSSPTCESKTREERNDKTMNMVGQSQKLRGCMHEILRIIRSGQVSVR